MVTRELRRVENSLIVIEPDELNDLHALIAEVTGKQKKIARLDLPRKPHKQSRVDAQCYKHITAQC